MWSDPADVLNREFDRMLGRFAGLDAGESLGHYPVDISEDENYIYVDAEMPGFSKEEVDITLEAGVLTITAERKSEQSDEQKRSHRHLSERRFTRVQRSFTMPSSVDEGKVEATLTDGVLHLKLHKREEVKPRKIAIK